MNKTLQIQKLIRIQLDWSKNVSIYWTDDNNRSEGAIRQTDLAPLEVFEKYKSSKLEDNDVVYFTKMSTLPRVKYNEYIESSGLKVNKTNRYDMANAYIFSFNTLKDILYSNSKSHFYEYYEIPVIDVLPHVNDPSSKKKISKHVNVYLPYSYSDVRYERMLPLLVKTNIEMGKYPKINLRFVDKGHGLKKFLEEVVTYNGIISIINEEKRKIILDESLSEAINEGVTIDGEMYSNISSMLNSSDISNVTLGFEVLSNCDYAKSLYYITILLNEYHDKIKLIEKTKNLSNCLNYFKIFNYKQDWEYLSQDVANNPNTTDEGKQIIKEYIIHHLNKRFYKSLIFKDINVEYKKHNNES